MKQGILTAVALLVGGVLFGLAYIYSGLFPIAANDDDSAIKEWVFETTMEEAVTDRASGIQAPADLDDPARIAAGVSHYDSMCVTCHGAPGKEHAPFAEQMNPEPPELVEEAEELPPAVTYWITKHGIEMTGMPAWDPGHSEEDLWNVVAAVQAFPQMSPEMYSRLAKSQGHHAPSATQQGEEDSSEQQRGGGPVEPNHHGEDADHDAAHMDDEDAHEDTQMHHE